MAHSLRRLISTLAIAVLLAAVLPSAGFGGGSDEPGYTGGTSCTIKGGNSDTPAVGSATRPGRPELLVDQEQTQASAPMGVQEIANRLAAWWLSLGTVLPIF